MTVPAGPHLLSDIIMSSPVLQGSASGSGAAGFPMGDGTIGTSTGADNSAFEFGFDPSLDPELAAVRCSTFFDRLGLAY